MRTESQPLSARGLPVRLPPAKLLPELAQLGFGGPDAWLFRRPHGFRPRSRGFQPQSRGFRLP